MKSKSFLLAGLLASLVSCKSEKSAPAATPDAEAAAEIASDGSVVLAEKDSWPAVGSTLTKTASMTMKDASLKIEAMGQAMEGTMNQTKNGVSKDEVLAPGKFRRLIESDSSSGKMTINGADQSAPDHPNALIGLPVICEKKDDKWTAVLESGTPTAEQAAALDSLVTELGNEAGYHMYGEGKAFKPGDEWNVDPSKIGFSGGKNLTGDYKVKFVEIKEHEGVKCAVLKATFDFSGKTQAEPSSPEMSLRVKGEATSYRSIVDQVDLEVAMEGTMTVSGSPNPAVTMEMEGPMTMSQKSVIKQP